MLCVGNYQFFLRVWMRPRNSPMTIQEALEVFLRRPEDSRLIGNKKILRTFGSHRDDGGELFGGDSGGGVSGIPFFFSAIHVWYIYIPIYMYYRSQPSHVGKNTIHNMMVLLMERILNQLIW